MSQRTEFSLPEGAICSTTCHGTQQEWIDLNDLLDCTAANVGPHGGSRVDSNDDSLIEHEGKCGCSMFELVEEFSWEDGRVGSLVEMMATLISGLAPDWYSPCWYMGDRPN